MGTSSCCCFEEPVPWVTASSCKQNLHFTTKFDFVSPDRLQATGRSQWWSPSQPEGWSSKHNANCKYLKESSKLTTVPFLPTRSLSKFLTPSSCLSISVWHTEWYNWIWYYQIITGYLLLILRFIPRKTHKVCPSVELSIIRQLQMMNN